MSLLEVYQVLYLNHPLTNINSTVQTFLSTKGMFLIEILQTLRLVEFHVQKPLLKK